MSRISDVSSKLGQYMLAGWVLTDDPCATCSVPMLRSPAGQSPTKLFCVQCQDSPGATTRSEPPPPSTASASSAGFSRVSTPPTEVSSTLSSPTFAPPPDPQETIRRRAQSDLASAEIGRRMLRGWAMLAEECSNDLCYGVPLVRPPKPGGKDPRKECVICGRIYIFQKDSQGFDRLVRLNSNATSSVPQPFEDPASRPDNSATRGVPAPTALPAIPNVNNHAPIALSTAPDVGVQQPLPTRSIVSSIQTLDASIASLDHALVVLTNRLTALSRQEPVQHLLIGDIALSIEKVTTALRAAKQLRFDEGTVYGP